MTDRGFLADGFISHVLSVTQPAGQPVLDEVVINKRGNEMGAMNYFLFTSRSPPRKEWFLVVFASHPS